jgi:hypothetical protein
MSEESFHLNRINSAWDRKAREAIETLSCYLEAAISTRIASICCLAVSRYSWGKVASINKSFVLLGIEITWGFGKFQRIRRNKAQFSKTLGQKTTSS